MKIDNIKFIGIENQKVYHEVSRITSTLENYAKSEKIKIKFTYESESVNKADHKLNITVKDNKFLCGHISKSISPDTDAITIFQPNKTNKHEDTFARQVYRTVSELTEQIRKKRIEVQQEYFKNMLEYKLNRMLMY